MFTNQCMDIYIYISLEYDWIFCHPNQGLLFDSTVPIATCQAASFVITFNKNIFSSTGLRHNIITSVSTQLKTYKSSPADVEP